MGIVRLFFLVLLISIAIVIGNEGILYWRADPSTAAKEAKVGFEQYASTHGFSMQVQDFEGPIFICRERQRKSYLFDFTKRKTNKLPEITYSAIVIYGPFDVMVGEGPFERRCNLSKQQASNTRTATKNSPG